MKKLFVFLAFCFIAVGGCISEYNMHNVPSIINVPKKKDNKKPEDDGTHYGTNGTNVDVLVVLDTSCSMLSDISTLDNIPDIVLDLQSRPDINWRLGIMSADPDDIDLFLEIDLRDEDAHKQMTAAVDNLMNIGPWDEKGLDSILRFYDEELWFREVFTIFVIVTDEREQSSVSAEEFVAMWPTNFDLVSVSAGPEFTPGCYADYAPKLWALATKKIDICDDTIWSIF